MTHSTKSTPTHSSELSEDWASFAQKLATVLAKLNEDEFMCLSVNGSDRYVRFSLEWTFGMRVETTSNIFLEEQDKLDGKQVASLIAADWNPPTWTPADPVDLLMNDVVIPEDDADPCPNYFMDLTSPVALDAVASLAVRTFTDVLGIDNPALLEYFAFDQDDEPIEFPELGLKFDERELENEDLSLQLLEAIRGAIDDSSLECDDDGDIGVRFGSALVFVRMNHNNMFVSIFSQILTDVRESTAVLSRLNEINSNEIMLRVFYRDNTIYGVTDIPAVPFVDTHVAEAFGYFCDAADRMGNMLKAEFGGQTEFEENSQSNMLH